MHAINSESTFKFINLTDSSSLRFKPQFFANSSQLSLQTRIFQVSRSYTYFSLFTNMFVDKCTYSTYYASSDRQQPTVTTQHPVLSAVVEKSTTFTLLLQNTSFRSEDQHRTDFPTKNIWVNSFCGPLPWILKKLLSDWLSVKIGLQLHNKSTWLHHVIDLITEFGHSSSRFHRGRTCLWFALCFLNHGEVL